MKRFLTLCLAVLTLFALVAMDAQAKRFGGGSSIGKQRQSFQNIPSRAPAAAPAPTPAPAQAPGGASRWLGPLAGLAAGGLLASMFMGGGMGAMGSLLPMLLLAAVAFMIFRMLKRPAPQPMPMQYAGMGQETVIAPPPSQSLGGAIPAAAPGSIPEGFDVEGFLHHAKVNFVRLQAANDAGNLSDIREFTTPEIYAEISLSIKERGEAPQQTDVVSLAADLLDVSTENDHHLASVRFSGMIREASNAPAENFDEIWHLQKPIAGNAGWVIAGIQQVH